MAKNQFIFEDSEVDLSDNIENNEQVISITESSSSMMTTTTSTSLLFDTTIKQLLIDSFIMKNNQTSMIMNDNDLDIDNGEQSIPTTTTISSILSSTNLSNQGQSFENINNNSFNEINSNPDKISTINDYIKILEILIQISIDFYNELDAFSLIMISMATTIFIIGILFIFIQCYCCRHCRSSSSQLIISDKNKNIDTISWLEYRLDRTKLAKHDSFRQLSSISTSINTNNDNETATTSPSWTSKSDHKLMKKCDDNNQKLSFWQKSNYYCPNNRSKSSLSPKKHQSYQQPKFNYIPMNPPSPLSTPLSTISSSSLKLFDYYQPFINDHYNGYYLHSMNNLNHNNRCNYFYHPYLYHQQQLQQNNYRNNLKASNLLLYNQRKQSNDSDQLFLLNKKSKLSSLSQPILVANDDYNVKLMKSISKNDKLMKKLDNKKKKGTKIKDNRKRALKTNRIKSIFSKNNLNNNKKHYYPNQNQKHHSSIDLQPFFTASCINIPLSQSSLSTVASKKMLLTSRNSKSDNDNNDVEPMYDDNDDYEIQTVEMNLQYSDDNDSVNNDDDRDEIDGRINHVKAKIVNEKQKSNADKLNNHYYCHYNHQSLTLPKSIHINNNNYNQQQQNNHQRRQRQISMNNFNEPIRSSKSYHNLLYESNDKTMNYFNNYHYYNDDRFDKQCTTFQKPITIMVKKIDDNNDDFDDNALMMNTPANDLEQIIRL